MNKLKEAIADLRAYLGRDSHGVKLLADVERIANDVRRQAATEKERAESASRQKATSDAALSESELEIEQLKEQLRREQDMRRQAQRESLSWKSRADELEREKTALVPEPDLSMCDDDRARVLLSAGAALRRWRQHCPPPTRIIVPRVFDERDRYGVYEIGVVMPNMSGASFTNLGRFVAVMAMINMPCLIESAWLVGKKFDLDKDARFDGIMRWFAKKNMDFPMEGLHAETPVSKLLNGHN